ncbi:hypothetical protein ACTFIW_001072 [Dictyostelium discoideum]
MNKKFIFILLIVFICFLNISQSIRINNNKNKNKNNKINNNNYNNNNNNNNNNIQTKEKRERNLIKFKEIEKLRKFLGNVESLTTIPLVSNEKIILEKLYSDWNGKDWDDNTNWLNGDPCMDQWYGIECNSFDGGITNNVISIKMSLNNIVGEMSTDIKNLVHLQTLDISNNGFYGEIPIGIFQQMNNLSYISLNENEFQGDLEWASYLPDSIVTLWIAMNQFQGTIPSFFSKYPILDLLFLEENLLVGTIPPEVGDLKKIKLLDFGLNTITGTIPSSIGNLSYLEQFWLYDNKLEGSIPLTMGNLQNLKLFEVTRNQLGGDLSGVFLNNPNLKSLRFSGNSFYGDLDWICQLDGLRDIHFDINKFESLPNCIGKAPLQMNELLLADNLITGTIPSSIGNMIGIEYINLARNNLTGTIPSSFNNFSNLNRIDISSNKFNCSLSEILGPIKHQTHLTIISAQYNEIHGEFFENMVWDGVQQIELLTKIFIINLSHNKLSGSIPEYLSWMPNLNDLDLSYNNLSGTVPNQLSFLSTMYLENNPYLGSSDGSLPLFMEPSVIFIHKDTESYACPSIIGKGFDIRISLDSTYYNNSFCLCDYNYRGVNGSCKICPQDSYCPGGGNDILIPSGYYPMPSNENPEYLLKCIISNFGYTSCNPDSSYNYTCQDGYQGRLCSKCVDGYFHKGTECSVCPTGPQSIVIFIVVVVVFIALFLFFVMTDPKRSLPSSTRKTVMYYYQVFNLLLSKLSPWPSFFSIFYSGSSWLNFSFGFLCINNLSRWPNLFIVMICLPFAFLVISIVFIASMQLFHYVKSSLNGVDYIFNKKLIYSGVRVNLLALNFLYLPLCIYIFQNYPCTKDQVTGESFMSFFPWQECGDNSTHNRIMRLTIAFTIIYVIGIPLLFAILLFYNRKRLDNPMILTMIGSIYIDYRKSVYWYELVALGRRFFMAVSLALIDPKSSFSIFVVLLVIGSSIISQIIFKPYVYRISNYSETIGNSVLLFSYVCILILSSLATTKLYDSQGIEIILSVVVVVYTVLLLLLFLFSLKYFLPKKWQTVIDYHIIKFITWVRITSNNLISDIKDINSIDGDDSFETTKEPIFERTVSNNLNVLGSFELKRRNSQINSNCNNNSNNNNNIISAKQLDCDNNNNNNYNGEKITPGDGQDCLISLSIDNSGTNFNHNNNDNNNNNNNNNNNEEFNKNN